MALTTMKTAVTGLIAAFAMTVSAAAAELKVVGTGDGLEMLHAVAVAYLAQNPNAKLSIPPSVGSGGGIAAVGSGEARMGRVARPLKDSEVKFGLAYIPVVKIPSAIITHPSSQVSEISSDDLRRVYAGEVDSWSELGGADVKVRVVRREEADSTLQVLRATMPGWSDLKITARSKTALTTQESIDTVRQVSGTIGFGPYSRELDFDTRVLKIDGKFPTDPDYPSSVTLALIYKKGSMDRDMKDFLEFCLSEEAAKVIESYGGVPVRRLTH